MKLKSDYMRRTTKSWDDAHLTELNRYCSDSPSKSSKVILVIAGDFFYEPMFTKSSDDCGYLTCRLRLKKFADIAVTETADIEFSTNYRDEDVEIVTVKEPGGHSSPGLKAMGFSGRFYEIEIVQTLAGRWFEKGFARLFIVPWFEGIAGFHGREDMHQTRMFSSLPEYLLYAFLSAEILLLDEVDCHAFIYRNFFDMRSDVLPKLFRPIRILEYKNPLLTDKPGHGFSMSHGNQRAGYYDPVVARKRKGNLLKMAFGKRAHGYGLSYQPCYSQLPYAA
jgi:hypothetical protein